MREKSTTLLINVLLAVVSTALFLGLLEGGARLIGLESGFFLTVGEGSCLQRSALLSLELRPNCEGSIEETQFRTNSLGLRGDDLRHDGARRILCLGDSCTWGWRVQQAESYPAVLQQLLDTRIGPGRFEVINAGVPGYTSYQGLLYLRERGLALQPSIVILAYGFNDTFLEGDIEAHLARLRRLMPVVRADDALVDQSTFYRWVRWRLSQAAPRDLPVRVPPERYERNLTEMIRLARDHGAKVMMLSFWNPFGRSVEYHEAITRVIDTLHVTTISFIGPKIDIVHPTAEGYRQLAEEVFDQLRVEGALE